MKYRSLSHSGLSISAIGLGCMGMSEFYGPADDAQSLQTLAHAVELGVNFLDTADTYGNGHNEELIGRFLAGRRETLVVASKCGIRRKPGEYARTIDNSPAYIRSACEASLRHLGLETIDLYYLHRYSGSVPIEEIAGVFAALEREGKIRGYGLSEVSDTTLRRAHAAHPVTALQMEYSLWTRDAERRVLATCAELGIAFVAYSPLGRGFLTGRLADAAALADNDFRRSNPRFSPENAARNHALVDRVQHMAVRLDATAAQVALAWLLSRGDHVVPIPGTRKKAYLEENISAVGLQLEAADVAYLDNLFTVDAIAGARYTDEGMKGLDR